MEQALERLGPRYPAHDPRAYAPSEAHRPPTQMFVLHWTHPNVCHFIFVVSHRSRIFASFLDMLLSKSIGGSATEPKWFWNIFEVCLGHPGGSLKD